MRTSTLPPLAATWYLLDAENQVIGRIASRIAHVLRGKHRVTFAPNQPGVDHVIVVNIEKMAVQGSKLRRKTYYKSTGYPGNVRVTPLKDMLEKRPEDVLLHAVKGMLRTNRLRPGALKRLHVIKGTEHRYAAQKPVPLTVV
jgi:large subunit ribosomal protein L13